MEMKQRTKEFARRVVLFCRTLPESREGRLIGGQLFRSGTSVGANYRAACRARSRADFISKLGIVEEEADESLFWLEIIDEVGTAHGDDLEWLRKEVGEILAMTVASINTARKARELQKRVPPGEGISNSALSASQSALVKES